MYIILKVKTIINFNSDYRINKYRFSFLFYFILFYSVSSNISKDFILLFIQI